MFVFDGSLSRVEVVAVDAARDDQLLVRCSPPLDEARVAVKEQRFPQLLERYVREALAAVAVRFELPKVDLGETQVTDT